MKAISICQPWGWYIGRGVKLVENRTWKTPYRGLVLIHVSKKMLEHDRVTALEMAKRADSACPVPSPAELREQQGKIIAVAELVDCVQSHPSPFFQGPWAHVYSSVQLFRDPVPWRGELGLFDVPDSKVPEVRRTLAAGLVGDLFGGSL